MDLRVDVITDTGWGAEGLAAALQRGVQSAVANGMAAAASIQVRSASLERWLAQSTTDVNHAPDVIVALMPDVASGAQVLRHLPADTAVLWLHPASGNAIAPDAVPDRPTGRLPASATDAQLAAAVHALAQGLSVSMPEAVHPQYAAIPAAAAQDLVEPLTARELEVLELMAKGLANREIAEALGMSSHTAKFHVAQILDKTGSATRTEAVRQGLRLGLIGL